MGDNKHKLSETAETLDEVAAFAGWLQGDAEGKGETAKAARLTEQGSDLRSWAAIYRTAAESA